MSPNSYRLTVIGCAVSWLLVGLHAPVIHDLSHADRAPQWGLLAITALLVVLAVWGTLMLLRAPGSWTSGAATEPPAV